MSAVQAQDRCNQCTAVLTGPYCQSCGQPSLAVRRSFGDVIYGQTGRLLHTLWLVIGKPGELAREIDEARDRRSMRPGALLTNLIAAFFLIAGGVGGFSARTMIEAGPRDFADRLVAERTAARGVSREVFDERLESRFRAEYSILITLSSLSYAFAIGVVERRRRKAWLVHLAAGIQYLCFTFLTTAVLYGISRLAGFELMSHPAAVVLVLLVLGAYIATSLRRVYGDPLGVAVAKTLFVLLIGIISDSLLQYASLFIAIFTA